MSTTDSFPFDFLAVFIVGGAFSLALTVLVRDRVVRSWKWRAFLSLLFGMTITPTAITILKGPVICPAIMLTTLLLFDGGKNSFLAVLYGLLPILCVAGVVFSVWSVIVSRGHQNERRMG